MRDIFPNLERENLCYIYVFSFALHPEDPSPSGSCNMSRIDHVDLALQLQDNLGKEQVTVLVFARNWNILRSTTSLGRKEQAVEPRGSNGTTNRRGTVFLASVHACRAAHPLKRCVSGRRVVRGRRSTPRYAQRAY